MTQKQQQIKSRKGEALVQKQPYRADAQQVADELDVWPAKGLTDEEVKQRHEKYGYNQLEAKKKISPLKIFISQFKDVLVIILMISAVVSLGVSQFATETHTLTGAEKQEYYQERCNEEGAPSINAGISVNCSYAQSPEQAPDPQLTEKESPTEGLLILAIVFAIAAVGFFNEYKAEKTVEALKKLVSQKARVRRNGKVLEVNASELVPGDIVLLEEGQKVPADVRLAEVKSLRVDEASLTGESQPVSKHEEALSDDASLGDQNNMAFSGTFVTSGTGESIVVATGNDTEIGKIADMVNDVESEQTPMQRKLDQLGRQLGIGIIIISIVVFVVIFFFNRENADAEFLQRLIFAFTAAVALAVAAIPEGLAFVVRISLALGARRMATKNALVRKLSAVEALGSTDVICSDKTGTLTRGEMTVRKIWTDQKQYSVSGSGYDVDGKFSLEDKEVKDLKKLTPILRVGLLCNNAQVTKKKVLGDPTEAALLVSAHKAGMGDKELKRATRIDEMPFTSDRKRMSTVHKIPQGFFVATKGAPEVVLDHCSYIFLGGKKVKLTKKHKEEILQANQNMAKDALRVLGFAFKQSRTRPKNEKEAEKDLVFIGLQGMMDPPRTEVMEVIHRVTAEAGMRVIMITGDHSETAAAVASEIGIDGDTITGVELDKLSQKEFEKRVEEISVYARVNPEHKIRIVQALKKHGHQVAMTGDGVNDAPAIKAADIGIAMGVTGTDASKEASDMILLDDQFLTIIKAIEEGRGIFDNVRKFVNYLLSANIAEVITILFGVLIFQDLVLTAAQLLFINIVTDGLPAIALGSDPAEKGIMRFKPHRFQGTIIDKRVWTEMFIFGVLMSVALLIHYGFIFDGSDGSGALAKSVAFAAMVVYEMVRLIDIRTDYHIKWFSNPWLSVAIAGSFALLGLVLYVGPIASVFELQAVALMDWAIIGGVSVALLVAMKLVNPVLDRLMPDVPSS